MPATAESANPTDRSPELTVNTSPRPGSRIAVEVAVPAARCQASYDTALEKLSRSIKLPGFRKGKVPRPVLLQQIGPVRIRATALEELVEAIVQEAIRQEAIEAIGRPELSEGFEQLLERFSPGSELTLTLVMDVEPSPSLKVTRGLKAAAESVPFDPARVDELIEEQRKRLATLVPVEGRPAAAGDVAVMSFEGVYADTDEPITGGSSETMEVELEVDRMIPGFVEGVIGMAVGENRTIECQFPDSYPQEEARGRQARFAISLKELKTHELPALDDSFAQQASDKQTLAELRQDLEQRLQEDAEQRTRNNRHNALLTALVEQLEVELPETLVQEEIRALIEQTAGQIAQQGMDVKKLFTPELVRSLMETSRPEAEQRLRRNLALQALAAAEAIEVAAEEIQEKLREVSRSLSDSDAIDPERLRLAVTDDLLRSKLLEWLEENSTISEAPPQQESDDSPATEATTETDPAAPAEA
ncbi:trigger factor [Synechococcus sp. CS-1328]|uniref:trigger factor n=1 Tax=Synechococcus sp. CS-1328 TaxID=2847976 RepID=UPI00223BA1E0|nr:trigger factor [Synechococcus sp. CS-1328]MCT0224952.1 trigger factor [Synechococcus sp. CS-1328]